MYFRFKAKLMFAVALHLMTYQLHLAEENHLSDFQEKSRIQKSSFSLEK